MAKKEKERQFHGELDWLRYQLRELVKGLGIEMKDVHLMKKEECQTRIAELNKEKYRKELEAESETVFQDLSEKNNQITELEKELVGKNKKIIELENFEISSTKELKEKIKKINDLEVELRQIQEINKTNLKAVKEKTDKLNEKEKELQKKNEEISELKAERNSSQITMEKLEEKIKQSEERTQKSLDSKNDFIDKLQEELNQLRNRKWWQIWK